MKRSIPFNKVFSAENTVSYLEQVTQSARWSGDGTFTKWCHERLRTLLNVKQVLLTPSGTAALEMAALLLDLQAGDEVILPSFTFSSTANSFLLRGAVPVFVDVRPDTMNIDETLIEAAITKNTKAVMPVHYAGVGCEMNEIMRISTKHKIAVIEDAAHAIGTLYEGKELGTFGQMSAFSFHETKNIVSGEGGAFVTNDDEYARKAEILREKGTNRSQFFRGQIDKYTWMDHGSSFLPSEFQSAVLKAQLESYEFIQDSRMQSWQNYHSKLARLEERGFLRRPIIPDNCTHNAHLYYILVASLDVRTRLIDYLKANGISALFHYVPLHQSPAGVKYGRVASTMGNTISISDRLLRLPLWIGLNEELVEYIVSHIETFFEKEGRCETITSAAAAKN